MTYYKVRVEVWCDCDPEASDLEQIVENIRTVNAICNSVLEFAQSKSLKLVGLASDLADRPQALLRG